jgi:hypothetical protein
MVPDDIGGLANVDHAQLHASHSVTKILQMKVVSDPYKQRNPEAEGRSAHRKLGRDMFHVDERCSKKSIKAYPIEKLVILLLLH